MRLLSRPHRGGCEPVRAAQILVVAMGLASGAVHAEVVRVEQVGAVGVGSSRGDLRQAAVERGIGLAVLAIAGEVAGRDPEGDYEGLRSDLGRDLVVYAEGFRVVEDRGRGPAPVEGGGSAAGEIYTVLVEVSVDRDRVERRLRERGVLRSAAVPSLPADVVGVEIRFLGSYDDFEALKALLVAPGLTESVVPRFFEPGRAHLQVTTRESPAALADRLLVSAPPELGLSGVRVEQGRVIVDLAHR